MPLYSGLIKSCCGNESYLVTVKREREAGGGGGGEGERFSHSQLLRLRFITILPASQRENLGPRREGGGGGGGEGFTSSVKCCD